MKILEQGREQKGWVTEVKCTGAGNGGGGCGSLLLVEEADVYATYNYDYTGDRDKFATFTCVHCCVETDLPENVVPSRVWNNLVSKREFFNK